MNARFKGLSRNDECIIERQTILCSGLSPRRYSPAPQSVRFNRGLRGVGKRDAWGNGFCWYAAAALLTLSSNIRPASTAMLCSASPLLPACCFFAGVLHSSNARRWWESRGWGLDRNSGTPSAPCLATQSAVCSKIGKNSRSTGYGLYSCCFAAVEQLHS